MFKKSFIFYFTSLVIFSNFIYGKDCTPKIAIIGGGIGGASASHYLSDLLNDNVDIDLFEADKIGGRLATLNINDDEYETGGSIIHSRNKLMRKFVQLLKLEDRAPEQNMIAGIWNGDTFVFEESSYQLISLAKLFYRYGLEPFKLHRLINSILDEFDQIYELQNAGVGFENITSLLAGMNNKFPEMLEISSKDFLLNQGYSSLLIDELVEATLVVNYGQDTDVHSFVGFVSLAGAGYSLWSVKGGNKKVPENLIKMNERVKVIPAVVNKINYAPKDDGSPGYRVYYNTGKSEDAWKNYDVVIIATPLTHDQKMPITFGGFPEDVNFEFPGNYQTTYASFVQGSLNPGYFRLEESIDGILSCDPNKTIVSSLGKLTTVQGVDSNVWKIFSRNPLEINIINKMFQQVQLIKEIKWKAYPKYSTIQSNNNFKLYNSLYHVNAIEWAASAMEMSAIGGRNVAILIYNDYKKKCNISTHESNKKKFENKSTNEL
ncbi:prenylcysteine oxidase 1-like [Microplitis mediator]|uniref:prenylcysteine oxidase 1-like n=1 Tax=Microplitis mediator TaxID=375433 RepID=UPI002553A75C|nr:prenylcysteine oxidase 1-like [Microplitis mediator]